MGWVARCKYGKKQSKKGKVKRKKKRRGRNVQTELRVQIYAAVANGAAAHAGKEALLLTPHRLAKRPACSQQCEPHDNGGKFSSISGESGSRQKGRPAGQKLFCRLAACYLCREDDHARKWEGAGTGRRGGIQPVTGGSTMRCLRSSAETLAGNCQSDVSSRLTCPTEQARGVLLLLLLLLLLLPALTRPCRGLHTRQWSPITPFP